MSSRVIGFLVACASTVLLSASPVTANDWKPLDPAHLALKQPRVQPGAHAEALIWDVRVADDLLQGADFRTTFDHYLRVKIFTDRGREMFATVDLPYTSNMQVRDVAARTVKADGSIVELKKDDVYRRTVVKANDVKIQVVSFAMPGIETGAIVEYRWREVFRDSIAQNLRLRFSRDIPVHEVRYFVKPLGLRGVQMQAWPFNGKFLPPEKQRDQFTMIALRDVPADADEEYGPPLFEQRPWVFISYEAATRGSKPPFAKTFAKILFDETRDRTKLNDEIRRLAAAAIEGRTTDAEKFAALARVARERLKRIDVDTVSDEERRAFRLNRNAGEALSRGVGTSDDVVLLLIALASAAGFDARAVASPDRGDLFMRSVQQHPYFFSGRLVAVRSGNDWLFADPGNEYAAAGELRWQYEDQNVLIGDKDDAIFARTPLAPAEASVKRRSGAFRLLDDGTLEGEMRFEFTGHWASMFREQEDQEAASEREKTFKEMIEKRLPGADVSEIRLENVTDPSQPYANTCRIRVPGYAQQTGSRMFLQPAVFQKGVAAQFQPTERKTEVYFPFPWMEEDTVRIELPPGYSLENPEAAAPLDAGSVTYGVRLSTAEEGRQVILRRSVVVGKGNAILFAPNAYPAIRRMFDLMHRADGHTLVLRKTGAQQ